MVVGGDVWSIASMDEQRDFPTFALFHIFIFPTTFKAHYYCKNSFKFTTIFKAHHYCKIYFHISYNIQSSLLLQKIVSYFLQYSKFILIAKFIFKFPTIFKAHYYFKMYFYISQTNSKLIAIVMTNFRAPLRRWLRGRLAAGFATTARFDIFQFYHFEHFLGFILLNLSLALCL